MLLMALASRAMAGNSAETKFTWGQDYRGYKASASADLDREGNWNGYLSYSKSQFLQPETAGWYDIWYLELAHFAAETLLVSGSFTYSQDSDRTASLGPGISLFYTWLGPSPDPGEILTLGFDGSLMFYRAELEATASETGGTATSAQSVRLTQAAPTLFVDYALIPEWLSAGLSGTCYFYSDDPVQTALAADPGLTDAGVSALSSLMSGLLWNNWQAGVTLSLPLPLALSLEAGYGEQKQVYPDERVGDFGLGLSARLFSPLKLRLDWKRYFSSAGENDLFSVAGRWYF